ncbi:cytochrome C oxidase subunit IV family protein [Flavimarina sp. Hel_I_48]|uniref:cytochrome C oxidase subunit IV family protein n=1 Tax=Flavimarina sp. Hel_I_48 TaxID=1392488 RepID=UPI0004DF75A8|nr:cytochrome C oxidase subunit IV family protein [Flavimarina sp. Hel_I_48]
MAHDASHTNDSESNSAVKRIWKVFIILSVVTIAEVILGIFRPEFLEHTQIARMKLLNWIFILLTVYKAYLITWAFMHMEHETKGLRRSVVWTSVFLIAYLVFILLTEGDYIHDVYTEGYQNWNF